MTPGRRLRSDRGSSDALGLALLAPAAIGLALVIVFLGRNVDARATVHNAAESAAQAAAQERSASAAVQEARRVAGAMLTDTDSCADPTVAVDTSEFRPGGTVSVTVTCHPSSRGLEPIDPPTRSHTVTAIATIDPLRAGDGGP